MATYQMAKIDETSPEYINAMQLHHNIMANGTLAASAMVELCRNLKQMRDKAAFIHLGYDSFDDYCEKAANIKKRQAYNYISTFEKLGPEVLQSNAQLGITKLQLLAQVPDSTREDLIESGQADELSTRRLKELTEELTKAREQLSFLEEKEEDTKQANDDAQKTIQNLKDRIEQLTAELGTFAEKARAEIKKEIETEILRKEKEKTDKAIAKAKEDAEKKITAARDEGMKSGREVAEKGLEAIEKEKADALAKAAELEKKLQISGNQDTVLLAHLFSEFQEQFNKIMECIGKIKAADPEAGQKFQQAFRKAIMMMDQRVTGG